MLFRYRAPTIACDERGIRDDPGRPPSGKLGIPGDTGAIPNSLLKSFLIGNALPDLLLKPPDEHMIVRGPASWFGDSGVGGMRSCVSREVRMRDSPAAFREIRIISTP